MKYYSTKNKNSFYSLRDAVIKGLPDDNGLFMPESVPVLPQSFFDNLKGMDIRSIAYEVANAWFVNDVPASDLRLMVEDAYPFDAPLIRIDEETYIQELFHGPTLAFKDFGARFMSRLMGWMVKEEKEILTILVATSGDTGSAVASGFFNVPGIEVIILYPSGKVSGLQEKQLTTWGGNIRAIEVNGTFDDCQLMVKSAFLDSELKRKYQLTSANSINISRLVPQCFYYFRAAAQLENLKTKFSFVVPSGNFGNLTAGLFAQRMGLPIHSFVAATNANAVVPEYLSSGKFEPKKSVATISNAMDVGNPSNFWRMTDLFHDSVEEMRKMISGYTYTDSQTRSMMKAIYESNHYILDPHTAVGVCAWRDHQKKNTSDKNVTSNSHLGIILETAHPVKFLPSVKEVLGFEPEIPSQLLSIIDKEKVAVKMDASFDSLKSYLL